MVEIIFNILSILLIKNVALEKWNSKTNKRIFYFICVKYHFLHLYTCTYTNIILWCGGLVDKSCQTLVTLWTVKPAKLLCPWDSPSKNTAVGCHLLLQEIFPTQELNSRLLHCRQILYQLSYEESLSYYDKCRHLFIQHPENIFQLPSHFYDLY